MIALLTCVRCSREPKNGSVGDTSASRPVGVLGAIASVIRSDVMSLMTAIGCFCNAHYEMIDREVGRRMLGDVYFEG